MELDSISSPWVKIQIMGVKVCLRCKGKTLVGVVKTFLRTKSLLTSLSNVLPDYLKQIFPPMIWIFTQGEEDEIVSNLSSWIFSTLLKVLKFDSICGAICQKSSKYFNLFSMKNKNIEAHLFLVSSIMSFVSATETVKIWFN